MATMVQILKNMPSAHSICSPLPKRMNWPGIKPYNFILFGFLCRETGYF